MAAGRRVVGSEGGGPPDAAEDGESPAGCLDSLREAGSRSRVRRRCRAREAVFLIASWWSPAPSRAHDRGRSNGGVQSPAHRDASRAVGVGIGMPTPDLRLLRTGEGLSW